MGDKESWTIEKSIASLKACLGGQRTEDDMYSTDITQPTTTGGTTNIAAGIEAAHLARVDSEGDI
jgi:hypothetical protein